MKTKVSGTRRIEETEMHLSTIEKYQLLRDLIDSNGYIDETVLEKLRLNIRALLESEGGSDKSLLDLCLDVVYHPNMKALGLQNLLQFYIDWQKQQVTSNGVSTD
ncbi:MAG: hypothetical protein K2I98_00140 [Prevotella sp.]|nr:hypothetical protein [Prevotella sp.]